MYLFVLFRPLFWCWVNLFTAAIDLIKYLITCNWFWLIGSNNIYTRADWAQSPVKSNKIHVKENQSLTLTCESEGGLTFKWIEQICHFTQIRISWNRNWVWVRVKQFWHQCTLLSQYLESFSLLKAPSSAFAIQHPWWVNLDMKAGTFSKEKALAGTFSEYCATSFYINVQIVKHYDYWLLWLLQAGLLIPRWRGGSTPSWRTPRMKGDTAQFYHFPRLHSSPRSAPPQLHQCVSTACRGSTQCSHVNNM